ncbi:MAG TPA: nitroreductase family protein [Jatrophihabitans sp.]|jgi:nitroreductase|uniref:Acg family FMN-binding oxidoreductase n=1 Tax=Jatrophihabitans sp. TaxID=1932789 RepID=UPI002E0B5DE6|nr:nitroreductase family protein [Jatrophihabitans sp.]
MSSPDGSAGPDLEAVVEAAGRAPSIHNTQPWRWVARDGVLDVRADRNRQLHVADRDGHSLLISCGAALELTELALAAQGWAPEAAVLPDPADPDLLARLRPVRQDRPDELALRRIEAALGRRSERRPFGPEPVAGDVVERLAEIGNGEGVYVHFPTRADENLDLAVAISQADRSGRDDPAYAAEMAAWVRADDPAHDGVPMASIPRVPAGEPRHTDIPLRDFEVGVAGGQLITPGVDEHPQIAVILTETDGDLEQLRAGQAMMRLMVQAELEGIASCPLSQSVDLLAFRTRLRTLMGWTGYPQMMLRLGQRPAEPPAPLTPRRPVSEVLTRE